MSLVNDALRKARLEAARQETSRSGAILPTLGVVRSQERSAAGSKTAAVVALAVVAVLAALLEALADRLAALFKFPGDLL